MNFSKHTSLLKIDSIQHFLIIVGILLFMQSCATSMRQKLNSMGFELEFVKVGNADTEGDTSELIKRDKEDEVALGFFENFNDTVIVCFGKKQQGRWIIDKKNNPAESSGYSGIQPIFIVKKRKQITYILLLRQRRYIEFEIDRGYPLYTIQRYDNIWYVNPRRHYMFLK